MERFEYRAKDKKGKTVKGLVEARGEKQAAKTLQERGFLIVSLRPKGKSLFTETRGSFFGRVSASDRVNFTRQLSTMMTAGLPVTDALSILEAQASPAMSRVIGEVLAAVEGGGNLADALEKHPRVFDQLYIALIRAGEAAGILDKILNRLADNLEKQKEFRSRVKGAMIYPAMVVGGMILVAAIMVVFVIPKMMTLFEEFQAELPLPTKILLAVSKFVTSYWWFGLLVLTGLVFGLRLAMKRPEFKKQLDKVLFRLPILGKLRRQIMLTEFTRTLGLLIGAGILIVDAIEIVRRSLKSPLYEEAIEKVAKEVEKGLPLATALARTELFPPLLPQMVAVGEETGKIDEVLAKVSAYFEQEANASVRGLTAALEPIIMIVLGIGVGFLVISIIMPIYNLTSQF